MKFFCGSGGPYVKSEKKTPGEVKVMLSELSGLELGGCRFLTERLLFKDGDVALKVELK